MGSAGRDWGRRRLVLRVSRHWRLLKISQHRSQAVSLAVTALPVTLPAALLYAQQGTELPWATIVALIVGLWIGTGIGARLANRVSPNSLRVVLVVRIAAMAIFMAFKAATTAGL
jgi:uncharacterized membrane protein YfcA